ncbi:hypothetical protein Anas_10773, partial [Armadillidium nasatum]
MAYVSQGYPGFISPQLLSVSPQIPNNLSQKNMGGRESVAGVEQVLFDLLEAHSFSTPPLYEDNPPYLPVAPTRTQIKRKKLRYN